MPYVGYLSYIGILLVGTGGLILRFDVPIYRRDRLQKETKVAHSLGWLNLVLGVLVFLGQWVYTWWFF
jgi:hypothetical protein